LEEIQFSAKIKKLKTNNGGEYVNKEMTVVLEIKGIIHDLLPPYAHKTSNLPERMNRTIVTMDRFMTLDCADMILKHFGLRRILQLYILRTAYYIVLSNLKNHRAK
jgi:hypothetical protein